MNTLRLLLSAFVLLLGVGSGAAQLRQPIRVGSNVQESKLVERVTPVYPAEARAARVAGAVILQATIDEAGQVVDVQVLRGHPLLDGAAVDAVRQWRYAPTYLNGQPVSVIASVSVFLPPPVYVTVSQDGSITESGSAADPPLDQRIRNASRVVVDAAADVPLGTLGETLDRLQKQGVADIQLRGAFVLYESRLFYDAAVSGTEAPELALDLDRLRSIARRELDEKGVQFTGRFTYQLFVNEVGEIVGIRSPQPLKLTPLEDELRRARVVTPARRGGEPVPAVITVAIPIVNR